MTKALSRFLIAAALLASGGQAAALPSQIVYNVLIPNGPDLSDAAELGVMMLDLDADTGSACRYYLEWSNNMDPLPLSVECYVEERKAHAAASCVRDSTAAVTSVIASNPRLPCFGWDTNIQVQPVFLLVAGEDGVTGGLDGLIQFSAAATFLYAFRGELYI